VQSCGEVEEVVRGVVEIRRFGGDWRAGIGGVLLDWIGVRRVAY
jgi:hypothetical protein